MTDFQSKIQARATNGFWQSETAQWLDKLGGHRLAEEMGIPHPELLAVVPTAEELPEISPAVYKANRGYSTRRVIFYSNGRDLLRNQSITMEGVRNYLKNEDTQGPPGCFLVEQALFLRDCPANELKVFSFNGVNALIHYKVHATGEYTCVSPDWQPLPTVYPTFHGWRPMAAHPPRPKGLEAALDWASKITRRFGAFLRVDFLESDRGFYLGELTATPSGGRGFSESSSRWLGAFWDFSEISGV